MLTPQVANRSERSEFSPLGVESVPMPMRRMWRTPELDLVEAVLFAAQQRARLLAQQLRKIEKRRAVSSSYKPDEIQAEADELRAWAVSDSDAPFTLRWVCAILESSVGIRIDAERVGGRLLAGLDGTEEIVRAHRVRHRGCDTKRPTPGVVFQRSNNPHGVR